MERYEDIPELIRRYREQTATAEEVARLLAYLREHGDADDIDAVLTSGLLDEAPEAFKNSPHIQDKLHRLFLEIDLRRQSLPLKKINRKKIPHGWAAAALLAVALTTALYFLLDRKSEHPEDGKLAQVEILPGYNQATLTLANGTKIFLDSAQSGIIVNDEDIKYQSGKSLSGVILSANEGSHKPVETHSTPLRSAQGDVLLELSTPKGGQYQIILQDGTRVWLNAASTLTYPSRFSGDRREVSLEGEAYFQVRPGEHNGNTAPFVIKTQNQAITVLGTELNVSSYREDSRVTTTLIRGAVRVETTGSNPKQSVLLKPSERTVLQDGLLQKSKADPDTEAAWKEGYFAFSNEPVSSIMRKIARWYNIEVAYRTDVSGLSLLGIIPRSSQLSVTLERLQKAGELHFSIAGRRVIVMK